MDSPKSPRTKLILSGLAIFALGCVTAPLIVPPLRAQSTPRWEYTCYNDQGRINVDQLNQYGSEGWELVGGRDANAFCFKRPLP